MLAAGRSGAVRPLSAATRARTGTGSGVSGPPSIHTGRSGAPRRSPSGPGTQPGRPQKPGASGRRPSTVWLHTRWCRRSAGKVNSGYRVWPGPPTASAGTSSSASVATSKTVGRRACQRTWSSATTSSGWRSTASSIRRRSQSAQPCGVGWPGVTTTERPSRGSSASRGKRGGGGPEVIGTFSSSGSGVAAMARSSGPLRSSRPPQQARTAATDWWVPPQHPQAIAGITPP